MVGNKEGREKLVAWLKNWKGGGRAALLVGPPGTGKTTTVHLAAELLGLDLVELNASDARTKEKMSKKIGHALSNSNLFGTKTLVFLDEVDGLAGRADYGAIDFIREAVRDSAGPVVMAANDPDSDEVRKLSRVTTKIEFRGVGVEELAAYLGRIASKEGLEVGERELESIAVAADGDLRSAINSLQSGGPARKDEDLTASRAVDAFFGATDQEGALKALRSYPGQPREKVRDLFVSVLKSRVHEERKVAAFDALSRADVLVGRMVRGRDWRLLRYLDPMLASSLWTALGDGGAKYSADSAPWPLQLRIWNDSRKHKDIAALAGRRLGISAKGSLVEDLPYLYALSRAPSFREGLVKSLGLEENYAAFVEKEASRSKGR